MNFLNDENNHKLAEYLRETRIEQNLTLDDISNKIGIPIQHLKKIEEGDFEEYDSFYLKMYLKKYASSLSLNIDEIYQHFYGEDIKKETGVKVKKPVNSKQNKQKRIHNSGKVIGVICSIIIVVLGILIAADMFRSRGNNGGESPDTNQIVNPNTPNISEGDDNNDDDEDNVQEEDANEDELEETPVTTIEKVSHEGITQTFEVETTSNELKVELTFTADCWTGAVEGTSIPLDSGTTMTTAGISYGAGDTETITLTESGALMFNVGNIQALTVTINGEPVELTTANLSHQWLILNMTLEMETE